MGAEVTLFSRSPGKEADARRLGADHIVISTDAAQMAAVAGQLRPDHRHRAYVHDVNPYVPTLAADGTHGDGRATSAAGRASTPVRWS